MSPMLLLAAAAFEVVSMEEAVQRALRHSPEAQAARASVAVAAAGIEEARVLPAPEFRLSLNNFDFDSQTLEERTTVGIRYSPPRPRELSLKQQIARARRETVEAEVRAAEEKIAARVRLAYRQAVIAEERAGLAARIADLHRGARTVVLRQVSAGIKEAGENELAELALSEAESELRRARLAAETAKRKLARLIHPAGGDGFSLDSGPALLAVPAQPLDTARLVSAALRTRADVAQAEGVCRQLQAAESLARTERHPWISYVQVTHRVTPIPDRGAWGFQVGVELPVFRPAAAAAVRTAAAQRARCEAQRQAVEARVQREVEDSAAALEQLRRELEELDRARSGPAERALQLARAALAQGRADRVDALNAEARILRLRDRWLERRVLYAELETQLESAAGGAPAIEN